MVDGNKRKNPLGKPPSYLGEHKWIIMTDCSLHEQNRLHTVQTVDIFIQDLKQLLAYLHTGYSYLQCHHPTEELILDPRNVRIIHFQRKCRQCDYRACTAPLYVLKQHYESQSRLLYFPVWCSDKRPYCIHYTGILHYNSVHNSQTIYPVSRKLDAVISYLNIHYCCFKGR